jgi:WD40 repeat protein
VFHAKPDIKLLFPAPFTSNFEKHMGPVSGVSCSPFLKRLFLTCSFDGTIRMYDVLSNRPVATFETGHNEYLQCVIWSPFRPTVFVASSNNGTVYIFDLMLSKQVPSYTLPYIQSSISSERIMTEKTAFSICFNPRQRDFLAVGYYDGTAKIF